MSIQDEGQFYVRDVCDRFGLIPIDNFLFRTDDGVEVKIDHCGRPFVGVDLGDNHQRGRYRFVDTQAEALRIMAGVLEGSITRAEIEAWDDWQ